MTPLEPARPRQHETPGTQCKTGHSSSPWHLRPFPMEWPELPGPPKIGDLAPALPSTLEPVESGSLPNFRGRPHLLFFWATWCLPCKKAVPELLAFALDGSDQPALRVLNDNL